METTKGCDHHCHRSQRHGTSFNRDFADWFDACPLAETVYDTLMPFALAVAELARLAPTDQDLRSIVLLAGIQALALLAMQHP